MGGIKHKSFILGEVKDGKNVWNPRRFTELPQTDKDELERFRVYREKTKRQIRQEKRELIRKKEELVQLNSKVNQYKALLGPSETKTRFLQDAHHMWKELSATGPPPPNERADSYFLEGREKYWRSQEISEDFESVVTEKEHEVMDQETNISYLEYQLELVAEEVTTILEYRTLSPRDRMVPHFHYQYWTK